MQNRRAARVARRIQQHASHLILYELRDPRLENITVTRVEISDDLRHATIYYSVLGTEGKRRAAERGLQSARGIIRTRIARSLKLREAPEIRFRFDPSIERAIEVSKLLDKVAAELREKETLDQQPAEGEAPEETSD